MNYEAVPNLPTFGPKLKVKKTSKLLLAQSKNYLMN